MMAIRRVEIFAAALAALLAAVPAQTRAADEAPPDIKRQKWSFAGLFGQFDRSQLQRGYQIYSEVCYACHSLKRISYRNLAEAGGPEFPSEAVKALAASVKVEDGPDDSGKMFQRPGRLTDPLPSPYKNEKEARSVNNGALPPDLSLMARARSVEYHGPVWFHPFAMLRDVISAYQEGGVDYIYALLTGYDSPPPKRKLEENMHFNKAFPGNQIAMIPPLQDGSVKYNDATKKEHGVKDTLDQYARDIAAFLSWTADPRL